MEHSTPEHDQPAVSAEAPEVSGDTAAAVPSFRLGFVIPEFHFKNSALPKLRKQLRAVLRQAMLETKQELQIDPIGLRVAVQFPTEGFTEPQLADCRTGRKHPPASKAEIMSLFVSSLEGIVVKDQNRVYQALVQVQWGEKAATQVSIWHIDFERKVGVQ